MSSQQHNDDFSFFELTEQYPDEDSAIEYFTNQRWPRGVTCPRCKSSEIYDSNASRHMPLWKCGKCGYQFTVTSGTVMADTKIPLRKWLFAFHMLGGAKQSLSTRYIARQLGITLKSAWHLTHRIRKTMEDNSQQFTGIVEGDETYIGGRRKHVGKGYRGNKIAVQTIVQRNSQRKDGSTIIGKSQTIALNPEADRVDGRTLGANLRKHTIPAKTRLMTDENPAYLKVGQFFKSHERVHHKQEDYAHVEPYSGRVVTTNSAEGLTANLKRQIQGTHHSTSKKHLPRYLEEYDYKYNTRDMSDTARTEAAIRQMEGRRVTLYKRSNGEGDALIGHKSTEPGIQGTRRGLHLKRRKRS